MGQKQSTITARRREEVISEQDSMVFNDNQSFYTIDSQRTPKSETMSVFSFDSNTFKLGNNLDDFETFDFPQKKKVVSTLSRDDSTGGLEVFDVDEEFVEEPAPDFGVLPTSLFPKQNYALSYAAGVSAIPIIDGDKLIVGTDNGSVEAFDLNSGATIWAQTIRRGYPVRSMKCSSGAGVVIAVCLDAMYVLNICDGVKIFSSPVLVEAMISHHLMPVGLSDSVLVQGTAEKSCCIRALDDFHVVNNTQLISAMCCEPVLETQSMCFTVGDAHDSGNLYFATMEKTVGAIIVNSGRIRFEIRLNSKVTTPITVHSQFFLFGTEEGVIHCIDRFGGESLFQFSPFSESMQDRKAIIGEIRVVDIDNSYTGIVFCDESSNVFCVVKQDLTESWKLTSQVLNLVPRRKSVVWTEYTRMIHFIQTDVVRNEAGKHILFISIPNVSKSVVGINVANGRIAYDIAVDQAVAGFVVDEESLIITLIDGKIIKYG
ncbi:hypothetical protein PCE1_002189 [Barthelona sp. PCE]